MGVVVPKRLVAMAAALLLAGVLLALVAGADRAQAAGGGDTRLNDGCWRADPSYFVQIQHGPQARSSDARLGYTTVGSYNYWGQHTHRRCTSQTIANDKYAVDYPLDRGDAIFSPFRSGTVKYAGRSDEPAGYANYGLFVVIEADNGRYVSLSAHLNGIAEGIGRGARVTDSTTIGFAGNTGDPSIPTGRPHLHQAFYRTPSFTASGVPYGGAGLRVDRLRYSHGGGGVYSYGWKRSPGIKAKGSLVGY